MSYLCPGEVSCLHVLWCVMMSWCALEGAVVNVKAEGVSRGLLLPKGSPPPSSASSLWGICEQLLHLPVHTTAFVFEKKPVPSCFCIQKVSIKNCAKPVCTNPDVNCSSA